MLFLADFRMPDIDSTLSFYTLPFFDPIPVSIIPHIKGVSCFSHDASEDGRIGEDGTIKLCVIKRRIIQLYKIGELVQLKKVYAGTCQWNKYLLCVMLKMCLP